MKDPRLMKNAKSEVAMGHLRKIRSLKDLPSEKILISYLKKAAKLNYSGINLQKKIISPEKKILIVPNYFTKELKNNKKALDTFNNFSYSHKKEYVEWITEAKTDETKNKRIATTLEWLSEGKAMNWKYVKK